jgi:hypothetical protein
MEYAHKAGQPEVAEELSGYFSISHNYHQLSAEEADRLHQLQQAIGGINPDSTQGRFMVIPSYAFPVISEVFLTEKCLILDSLMNATDFYALVAVIRKSEIDGWEPGDAFVTPEGDLVLRYMMEDESPIIVRPLHLVADVNLMEGVSVRGDWYQWNVLRSSTQNCRQLVSTGQTSAPPEWGMLQQDARIYLPVDAMSAEAVQALEAEEAVVVTFGIDGLELEGQINEVQVAYGLLQQ